MQILIFILSIALANATEPIKAADLNKTAQGRDILRGKDYFENTNARLPDYVKAKINCTSCHMNTALSPNSGPWATLAEGFPKYSPRLGDMQTLTTRVNACFQRSLDGKPLPADSPEMHDIQAYLNWLTDTYKKTKTNEIAEIKLLDLNREPDLVKGKSIYTAKCSTCHQSDGQGLVQEGHVVTPVLWGDDSFNIGAGMARLRTAAGFVRHQMPLGQGGSLSDDEAWDVAAYFSQQPRPDFKGKAQDWPKGGKPKDARY